MAGERERITFTSLLRRGDGFQMYHSLEGERKVEGMWGAIGWWGSSTVRVAGSGSARSCEGRRGAGLNLIESN